MSDRGRYFYKERKATTLVSQKGLSGEKGNRKLNDGVNVVKYSHFKLELQKLKNIIHWTLRHNT